MPVDYLPQSAGIRMKRRALEQSYCGSIAQRPIDVDGVASDPAQIGGTKEDIVATIVEDIFEGGRRVDHVTACSVHNTFWFSSGATSGGFRKNGYVKLNVSIRI